MRYSPKKYLFNIFGTNSCLKKLKKQRRLEFCFLNRG